MSIETLGKTLSAEFVTVQGQRLQFEDSWLRDIRQYKGIYDPEVLAQIDARRSKAFIRETRTKVRTIDARIMDLLFPANGEKNWGIEPTPKPEFPEHVEKRLMEAIQAALSANEQQRSPTQEELDLARNTQAKIISESMAQEIQDQLAELRYRAIIREVIHSGHLFGTGWLKGPLVDSREESRWKQRKVMVETVDEASGQTVQTPGLQWYLEKKMVLKPYVEFKRIWDIYPDMSATELENCKFLYERHVMPKHQVQALINRDDFEGEYIRNYLEVNPQGDSKVTTFETTLYNLENADTAPKQLANLYQIIEYWGWVSGENLNPEPKAKEPVYDQETGEPIEEAQPEQPKYDPGTEYFCNVWVLGDQVIKFAVQPIEGIAFPYYPYYFDKDETSIFGEGVARIMRDPQRLVNASVRAMIDNAAHCAGPQYEVNVDLLADGEEPSDIGAFRVWMRTGKDADVAGKEVVRVKQITSYTPEFMQMRTRFSQDCDEVTIIPRYLQGDSRVSGAGRTASGLSMLMGQANVGLSDLVKMFDDNITKPFIKAMYHWNMQFNDKEEIKGDLQVVALGSTALLAKEIRAQQIMQFLQLTMNQYDLPWVKRNSLLEILSDSTEIGRKNAVRNEDERKMWLAEQQALMQNQQGGQENQEMRAAFQEMGQAIQQVAERMGQVEQVISQIVQRLRVPMIPQQSEVA